MIRFASFERPLHALVVGSSGSIGRALVDHLAASDNVDRIVACARTPSPAHHAKIVSRAMDVLDEASITAALDGVDRLDLVIVATGRLHTPDGLQPEKTFRAVNAAMMIESFAINAIGPTLVAKHTIPLLPRQGRAVFAALSARVGSISDNHIGGWYSYRASKAALNQLIKTLSIELSLKRKEAICVGLHPGTVDSVLSRPFQKNVAPEKLFAPTFAAQCLLNVIDALKPSDSGALIGWDGRSIEP